MCIAKGEPPRRQGYRIETFNYILLPGCHHKTDTISNLWLGLESSDMWTFPLLTDLSLSNRRKIEARMKQHNSTACRAPKRGSDGKSSLALPVSRSCPRGVVIKPNAENKGRQLKSLMVVLIHPTSSSPQLCFMKEQRKEGWFGTSLPTPAQGINVWH